MLFSGLFYLFFESKFLNLFSSYEFMMIWKQYHSNVFYAGAKRELFYFGELKIVNFPSLTDWVT